MRYAIVVACVGTLLVPLASVRASAQSTPKRSAEEIRKLIDAHQGDFDYLLGDWEFTAESREYGTFYGSWSAVRLEKGHILDEYRVVGDKGETFYVTTTLRNYNAVLDQWELVGLDAGSGLQDKGTGRRVGSEMHIEQTFGYVSGKPSLWKIRYYDIRPDQFSWSADRSTDGGKTWVAKHQTIQARRIGPSRSLAPLTSPRKSSQSAAATADPITGNWGSDGVTFLELKLEANNAVSGTAIWRDGPTRESRAAIKTGTFDPKTGVVRLEGETKRPDNGATVPYLIEGKLEQETLAGKFAIDDRKGDFTFTRK
jgi:hypothetical protein